MDIAATNEKIRQGCEAQDKDASVRYLAANLSRFVKKGDKVLLAFLRHESDSIGGLMEQAVKLCGGTPVMWEDHRWKSLLQIAFFSRASVIVGPPLVILSLAKLQKYTGLPLYIRHAVSAGYPCLDWMVEGIRQGLDCQTWGCLDVGNAVVAGFSCGKSLGVHIRQEEYDVEVLSEKEAEGQILLRSKTYPDKSYLLREHGRIETAPCICGCAAPRLMDIHSGPSMDPELRLLGERLHSWTSVLDCRIKRGEYGLELELIVFPGEKLPKLPPVAKQVIRPWDPKHDEPFSTPTYQ